MSDEAENKCWRLSEPGAAALQWRGARTPRFLQRQSANRRRRLEFNSLRTNSIMSSSCSLLFTVKRERERNKALVSTKTRAEAVTQHKTAAVLEGAGNCEVTDCMICSPARPVSCCRICGDNVAASFLASCVVVYAASNPSRQAMRGCGPTKACLWSVLIGAGRLGEGTEKVPGI